MSLKKYRNIHDDETCYIFGDGPSVKWFDYNSFGNHVGFSCGRQIFHKDFDKLNIKYYAIPEPFLFCPKFLQPYKYLRNFDKLTKHLKKEMKKYNKIDFFVNLTNWGFINGSNVHFIHRLLYLNHQPFSKINIDPFSGSFYTCLSLAYYMGFKKVFLVGHDGWTLRNQVSTRWYEHGYKISKELSLPSNNPFINFMKKNMDIYSIVYEKETVNFDSISYKSFTNKSPVYKENFELTTLNNLKVFNTYPLYNIYN